MLRRAGLQALQALLELAQEPERWRSVASIATAQELPAPMLEQLLLQLRRAGLVEARRGRLGGYRLARSAAAIAVAEVLRAVGAGLELTPPQPSPPLDTRAEQRVLQSMGRRLQAALERELSALSLEELLFDLSSWQESLRNDGGVMLG
jgi:Rrf2 family protein